MSAVEHDRRTWVATDRRGETLTIGRPLAGVELVSVRGSHRHWREAHESFTLALIHLTPNRVVADWHTRGRSLRTEGGEIMAIEPGETHATKRLTLESGAADFDIVRFSPELIAETARRLGVRPPFHFKRPAVNDRPTFEALGGLVDAVASGKHAFEVECASAAALHSLVSRLGEVPDNFAQGLDPVRDYRLRKVKDYLRAHLERRPTLTELATEVDISPSRLCVLFKRAYNIAIGDYWNALRLAEAVRRLQRETPVRMIVAELGYADEPHFWRVFKAHYGVAPGRWRSLYRANDRLTRASATRPRANVVGLSER